MEYKGFGQLVEAWPRVREVHPDAELRIIGPGDHPLRYNNVPGIEVVGFVDNLSDALEKGSLFVQPSRGDAFPVSTLEALRAGLPAVVTLTTGTRSEIRAVDGDLVVDTSPAALTEGIIEYFNRDLDDRRELSNRARERGRLFTADTRKAAFRRAFESLLREIDEPTNSDT